MEGGIGPAVAVLGAQVHDYAAHGGADRLRADEAADVAAVVQRAVAEGWTVRDPDNGMWRPIRLGDIAILIPARTSLDQLEEALDTAYIAYRAESSSLVYQAPEVHQLMLAARVVADPGDLFSCAMALRSPLFGCGDDDLWTWKRDGGSFNILAPVDADRADHPVGQAIDYLRQLHYQARWMTPSEVLGALVADRRMLEVAVDGPRTRDQWRRLRFVVDQARAWSEVEHGGLRSYLVWAAKQGEDSSRVAEAILPETDVDAVRILTIHGAKGLEFPMVVLSGMSSQPRTPSGVQLIWPKSGGYALKLTATVQTNDFKDAQPVDEQMDAYERRRLLYVATTRARDHLVVSLHRGQGKGSSTNAELIAAAGGTGAASAVALEDLGADELSGRPGSSRSLPPPPALEDWKERLETVRAATRHLPARSASGLEGTEPDVVLAEDQILVAGLHKGARDVELPPWRKGRYGDAIGRAVHGVLQTVELSTGKGLDGAVAAQCMAEGVPEHASHVRALVEAALAHEVVQRAATRSALARVIRRHGSAGRHSPGGFRRPDLPRGRRLVGRRGLTRPTTCRLGALEAQGAFYAPQIAAYEGVLRAATGIATVDRLLFLGSTAKSAGSMSR